MFSTFLGPSMLMHAGLLGVTFCLSVRMFVCTSRDPSMPSCGAKVVIWVLVGCEPTHWVQNWLVGCNLRIYMRTLLLEVKGLEGQGQRSRGSMSKVTSTESISKDLGNIGLGQIRFPNKGRMVHIIIHWWNSPCLCSDQSGGSFGQSIVIYLRLN